jgi:hypothetical protein
MQLSASRRRDEASYDERERSVAQQRDQQRDLSVVDGVHGYSWPRGLMPAFTVSAVPTFVSREEWIRRVETKNIATDNAGLKRTCAMGDRRQPAGGGAR